MILDIVSYFFIPLYSIYLARGTNWLTTNFSVISISLSRQIGFLLWSVTIGIYFYYCLRKIILILQDKMSMAREYIFLGTGCTLLIIGVLAPYVPRRYPSLSFLHVAASFVASMSLFLCISSICLRLYWLAPNDYRRYLISLIWISSICASLFLATGIINSAMEILFIISCTILVRKLYQVLSLENKKNHRGDI